MKYVLRAIVWLGVFLCVFVWRFPYNTVFTNMVQRVEKSTGAEIQWESCDISLLNSSIRDMQVSMPTGFSFKADTVKLMPTFKGVKVFFTQTALKGSGEALITQQNLLFKCDNLQMDTGSADLKEVRMSGDLNYGLNTKSGKGEMRLSVPQLSTGLPVSLNNLEIGSKVNISPGRPSDSFKVDNTLSLFGEGFTGEGNLSLNSQKAGSPALDGTLTIKTDKFGTHTIKIKGTWAKPEWKL